MTNPFQHGHPSFGGDAISSAGLPTPLSQRRSSYASVVSGASALSRPSRPNFHHLLNPSPDSDPYNNLYATQRNSRFDVGMTQGRRNGAPGEDGLPSTAWQPRLGAGLPYFSRAFEPYICKDPLFPNGGVPDDGFSSLLPAASSPVFLSPSYLRGSIYLQKLEDAHKARVAAEREGHAGKAQPGAGLVSGANAHPQSSKLPAGSHRGVQYEVVEKTPAMGEDAAVSPLPSRWSKDDKDPNLDVLGDGYEVKHIGRSSNDHEACAIRADHYMPSLCGVYYFEVLIMNRKREDTTIGVGFSSGTVSLQRAPGWEPDSWGYHGDDGHCYAAQNVGRPYGPKFGPGDTIGCLVNFRLGHALFTKNGDDLGIAFRDVTFKDVKGKLYPTVGLKKPGDHVLVNFGQQPFLFDIDGYMKRQRKMVSEEIRNADTSKLAPPLNETELIQRLVLQFLQHDGYVETARAFAKEIHAEKQALNLDPNKEIEGINIKDDEDANNRQRIRRAILNGDIDRALKYTKTYYPKVLSDNEQVYFRLRCRKFIEMIRKEAELNLLIENKSTARARQGEDDEEMAEADAQSSWEDQMETEDETNSAALKKLSHEALQYGMELRAEFSSDQRREVSKHLEEIFALIAYPNPLKVKEVAHLLDGTGRVAVAEELNSAILSEFTISGSSNFVDRYLVSLGKSSRAALENLYAQTTVLLEDLRQDGGDGAFVTVQSIIDSIPKPS
ncbi:hypothetical protein QBC34DRAFT_474055 [Podospora aff. communis PSN243]|uniref:Protein SSH4 n=1 Tax=Podospora aff. communis PSN243 TaxID=3040156 RepID=A0AAV9G9N0_9PEZI|nr:hypothetical protein QBC34DRAFT_474055 [Podospora aff. communis PSN243]